jgi:hypothetical protein
MVNIKGVKTTHLKRGEMIAENTLKSYDKINKEMHSNPVRVKMLKQAYRRMTPKQKEEYLKKYPSPYELEDTDRYY